MSCLAECGQPVCYGRGTCVNSSSCICDSPESLTPDCSITKNGCSLQYCSLAGQCTSPPTSGHIPQCRCNAGYYGESCQVREAHCATLLCSGLSNCTATGCLCPRGLHQDCSQCDGTQERRFKCKTCVDGVFGPFCNISQADCSRDRCSSNGRCAGRGCICQGAWTESSNCSQHKCPNSTHNATGECQCTLPDVYVNKTCSRLCVGGIYSAAERRCICHLGFYGSWCQYASADDATAAVLKFTTEMWVSVALIDVAILSMAVSGIALVRIWPSTQLG